jgi:hypothetical protein
LTGFADAAVSVVGAASFGNAVAVVADLASRTVAVAQAFIATTCGQALTVTATLTDRAIGVARAAAVSLATATVLAGFAAIAVPIGGAASTLRHTDIIVAGFASRTVSDVSAAAVGILALAVVTDLSVTAIAVRLAT